MDISVLSKQPQFVQSVSNMIYKEFVVNSASTKSLAAVEEFFSATKENTFPITFVAVVDAHCVGTVSIFENDWADRPQYRPWLASLFVEPEYRSQKIGEQLIACLLIHLKEMGYSEVFLKTENTSNYYKKRGWQLIESVKNSENEVVDIFKYTI